MENLLHTITHRFSIKNKPISYKREGIRPAKDWIILLGIVCLVLIIGSLGLYYFYYMVDTGLFTVAPSESDSGTITLNTEKLNQFTKGMTERKMRLGTIMLDSRSTDPAR